MSNMTPTLSQHWHRTSELKVTVIFTTNIHFYAIQFYISNFFFVPSRMASGSGDSVWLGKKRLDTAWADGLPISYTNYDSTDRSGNNLTVSWVLSLKRFTVPINTFDEDCQPLGTTSHFCVWARQSGQNRPHFFVVKLQITRTACALLPRQPPL